MALALTPFTALCGFLPLPKIADYLSNVREFAALIPAGIIERFKSASASSTPTGPEEKAALRDVFAAVMTADDSLVKSSLFTLVQRYRTGESKPEEQEVVDLVLTLNEQFPGDIGIFCAFLLNYLSLQPGEAIFLGAGEPHAYVSGGAHLHCPQGPIDLIHDTPRHNGMHGQLG
jgi:mannose-6-phosphate isomerase